METRTKVLQLGLIDWQKHFSERHQERFSWSFWDVSKQDKMHQKQILKKIGRGVFDVVICTDDFGEQALIPFLSVIEAHRLILNQKDEGQVSSFLKTSKCPIFMNFDRPLEVLEVLYDSFYGEEFSGGVKLGLDRVHVNSEFSGKVTHLGAYRLSLEGDFSSVGEETLISWLDSIGGYRYFLIHAVKFKLEFEHSAGVEIGLCVLEIGAQGNVIRRHEYQEEQVREGIVIVYDPEVVDFSVTLSARGSGHLKVGALHVRNDRQGYGEFSPGGEYITDTHNEELFYYFHPGNLKPPFNVYFSGFKTAEGFEAFYLMKSLGHPFLLVTDTRLLGGSFYLGSSELEEKMVDVIQTQLEALNFSNQDLILSGLSMGTFGALYYASFLSPYAVIAGKPLVNLDRIVKNGRLIRPKEFSTSFDLVGALMSKFSNQELPKLHARFWERFSQNNFEKTQFVLAHMLNDDYDDRAYNDLLEALSGTSARVIGKGIPGRHNDDTSGVVQWFRGQYQRLIDEGFEKGENDEV